MIVCPICKDEVHKHRPNQVICSKTLCKSRYTEMGRKGKRGGAIEWVFDTGFFNKWVERCYGR
jgi:hypothetical protein